MPPEPSGYFIRQLPRAIFRLISLTFITAGLSGEPVQHVVRIGYTEKQPLIYSLHNQPSGPVVEFLNDVARSESWRLEWHAGLPLQCADNLFSNKIDIIAAIPFIEEYSEHFRFTRESIVSTWGQIYVAAKANVSVQSLLDLQGLQVGIVTDDIYGKELRKSLKNMNISCQILEFKEYDDLFRALDAGWVQAGIFDRFYGAINENKFKVNRSSAIIAPIEIRFAGHTNTPPAMMNVLDYHLRSQKENQHSKLNLAVARIVSRAGQGGFMRYLTWSLIGIGLLLTGLAGFCLLLRRQVFRKTQQLRQTNEALRAENHLRQTYLEALKHSNELLEKTFAGIKEGIVVMNAERSAFFRCNQAARDIFKFSEDQFFKMSPKNLFPESTDRNQLSCNFEQALSEKGFIWIESLLRRMNGEEFTASIEITPLQDADGQIYGWVMLVRDITEQTRIRDELRKSETRLHMAQKMEAIGTLAGGIAHDMNNILTPIVCYTELLLSGGEGKIPSNQLRLLEQIFHAGNRARDLIKQILTFSRMQEEERHPVSVAPVLKEVLYLLRATLPANIEIKIDLESTDDTIAAIPTQLHQLLMNLCTNAAQSMRNRSGQLKVSTRHYTGPIKGINGFPDLPDGSYLQLSVSDNGHGIPADILNNIFDPFFTTKKPGEGTGMGLSVVHSIVKQSKGTLQVESIVGQGTAFHIYFPSLNCKAVGPREPAKLEPTPMTQGNEHILFVDDEPAIVRMATRILAALGYRVTTATDGQEALRLFRSQKSAFDLVVTDETMPKLTGLMLAGEILRMRPEIPVILCSGNHNPDIDPELKKHIRAFLNKPFRHHEITGVIRRVLDNHKQNNTPKHTRPAEPHCQESHASPTGHDQPRIKPPCDIALVL